MRNFDPEVVNMSLDEYIAKKMPELYIYNPRNNCDKKNETQKTNNVLDTDVEMMAQDESEKMQTNGIENELNYMQNDFLNVYNDSLSELAAANNASLLSNNTTKFIFTTPNTNNDASQMPPLVPANALIRKQNGNRNQRMQYNRNNRNRNRRNNNNNNKNNNYNNNKNNNNNNNNNNNGRKTFDLRFQLQKKLGNRNQQNNNQFRRKPNQNNYNNPKQNVVAGTTPCFNYPGVSNVNSLFNANANVASNAFVPLLNTNFNNANISNQNKSSFQIPQSSSTLEQLCKINSNALDISPSTFANKLYDFLTNHTNQTAHKPIYDRDIHIKICQLQNKKSMYTTDGSLISADGEGIDCKFTPVATSVSMNYRFG